MAEIWSGMVWPVAVTVLQILLIVVPLLVAVAYVTYAERKVIGAMQLRQGPMTVGPYGLLQPLADGLKLFVKETIVPTGANKVVFLMAPMVTFVLALIGWAVIPFGPGMMLATSMSGFSTCSPSPRSESMAWSSPAGRPTPNIPSIRRSARPLRW